MPHTDAYRDRPDVEYTVTLMHHSSGMPPVVDSVSDPILAHNATEAFNRWYADGGKREMGEGILKTMSVCMDFVIMAKDRGPVSIFVHVKRKK